MHPTLTSFFDLINSLCYNSSCPSVRNEDRKANGWVGVIHGTHTTISEGGVAHGSRNHYNNIFHYPVNTEIIVPSFLVEVPQAPKASSLM